jgi:two-component system response regulator NreC
VFLLSAILPADPWAKHARAGSRSFHKNDSESGSADRISILICEDHTIYREGVKSILGREPDLKVVGEASDGREAANMAALLKPDVMLLNLSLPGMQALDAVRHIKAKDENVSILVLGMYDDEDTAFRCRQAGASGYLLKDAPVPQLLLAVRHVRTSEQYLTPASLKQLDYLPANPNPKGAELAWNVLSPRQQEILLFLAEGFTYKEIGARLHLSVKTVDTHKYNLMRKLNIQSRAGLIRFAIRQRLIEA